MTYYGISAGQMKDFELTEFEQELLAKITAYLKQNGWSTLGEGHWYHADRDRHALNHEWALYYESQANKEKTNEFLSTLSDLPASIQRLVV